MNPLNMFDKLWAQARAALVLVALLLLTQLLGLPWGDILAPLADLEPLQLGPVDLEYGKALVAALVVGIPSGLTWLVGFLRSESVGYGFGAPQVPVVPAASVRRDNVVVAPQDVPVDEPGNVRFGPAADHEGNGPSS